MSWFNGAQASLSESFIMYFAVEYVYGDKCSRDENGLIPVYLYMFSAARSVDWWVSAFPRIRDRISVLSAKRLMSRYISVHAGYEYDYCMNCGNPWVIGQYKQLVGEETPILFYS